MLFLETWFWLFAAVAIPVYWICPRRLKLYWLLGACAVFHYHFAGPAGMAPIIVLAICTFFVGLTIGNNPGTSLFNPMWISLVAALVFYKYGTFIVGNTVSVFGVVHVELPPWLANWR